MPGAKAVRASPGIPASQHCRGQRLLQGHCGGHPALDESPHVTCSTVSRHERARGPMASATVAKGCAESPPRRRAEGARSVQSAGGVRRCRRRWRWQTRRPGLSLQGFETPQLEHLRRQCAAVQAAMGMASPEAWDRDGANGTGSGTGSTSGGAGSRLVAARGLCQAMAIGEPLNLARA